jgi:2-haloacid dehalogenase
VERTLSVEAAGVWKPAAAAYHWACDRLGVAPPAAMLVAVHPWDTDGAARAGLQSAWVDRSGSTYPAHFTAPTVTVSGFTDLAERLARGAPHTQ